MTHLFDALIDSIASDGYGVVDNFLAPDEVRALAGQLRQRQAGGQLRAAGIGQGQATVEKQIRGDAICWLNETDQTADEITFMNRIDALRQYVNQTIFLGVRESEFHYALYPPGTFYKRHLDQFRADSRRKLSLVCYLNTDWQPADGGQLAIYLPAVEDTEQTITIEPVGGRLVCFESGRLEHAVLPAARERLSLTGWLKTD